MKKKKKKSKKTKSAPKDKKANTFFGEIREQNVVERAKIEHDVRLYRTEKNNQMKKMDKKSKSWAFEYTGAPKPTVSTIWDDDPLIKTIGSKSYMNTMTLDILNSKEFTLGNSDSNPSSKRIEPKVVQLREVPTTCSPDEVLAAIKGAMYDVSSWLLEIESLNLQRQAILDNDLEEFKTETLDLEEPDEDEFQPPPYSEVVDSVSNDDEMSAPPYDEVIKTSTVDLKTKPPSPPSSKLSQSLRSITSQRKEVALDRMTLIFNALVGQQNNNAKWLGSNDKLTRLKLYGGLSSLLKLQVEWSQFDALWTKLDYKRSGDIDLNEFRSFFGDLSEFEQLEGTKTLSLHSKSKSIESLTKCLFELCDVLRKAGFTVIEMFSGFDRNGSGEISVSEFCSMLRLVVGNTFDKKLIYQALYVLDTDGSKSVSLEELLRFIYKIWRSELDELQEKLSKLDLRLDSDKNAEVLLLDEKQSIKEAIKKNFPRSWRDKLEREDGGHTIGGPFQSLMKSLKINNSNSTATTIVDQTSSSKIDLKLQSPARPTSLKPSSISGRSSPTRRANLSGESQVMRFKIKVPAASQPTRNGTTLSLPVAKTITDEIKISGEATKAMLESSMYSK